MTIQSTNITNHLLGLIQNLGTNNNRGETKVSSSKADSFESMFKECASTSHQPTSRRDTEAAEVSPDYYSDRKKAENSVSAEKSTAKDSSEKNAAAEKNNASRSSKEDSGQQIRDEKNAERRADQNDREEARAAKEQTSSDHKNETENTVSKTDKSAKSEKTEKSDTTTQEASKDSSSTVEVSEEATEEVTDAKAAQSLKELLQQILDLLKSFTSENGELQVTDSKELTGKLESLFQNEKFSEFWNKFKNLAASSTTSDSSSLTSENTKGQDKLTLILEQMLANSSSSEASSEDGQVYKEIEDIVSLLKNNKETLKNLFSSQNSAVEQNSVSKDFLQSLETLTKQIESQSNSDAKQTTDVSKTTSKTQTPEASLLDSSSQKTDKTLETSELLTKNSKLLKPSENQTEDSENNADSQETPVLKTTAANKENKPILDQLVQKINQNEASKTETEAAAQSVSSKISADFSKPGTAENIQKLSESGSETKISASENSQQNSSQTKMDLAQNPLSETTLETKNSASEVKGEARFTQYLSKAFASEREIIDKIISQAKLRMNNGEKELTLQLSPPELGHVKIQLNENSGVMSGKIVVDSEVIKEIVQSNLNQLKTSLNETVKIDKLDVEVREEAGGSLLQSFRDKDTQDSSGFQDRDKAYSDTYYEDDLQGSFGLETPLPKGLTQRENGALSVDLFL